MSSSNKQTIRMKLTGMRLDPHPYKPFAPYFASQDDLPILIDFDVPMKSFKTIKYGDGEAILLTYKGFTALLEEVTRVMLNLEPTRD